MAWSRRRLLLVAVGTVAVLAVIAVIVNATSRSSTLDALAPAVSETEAGANSAKIGEPWYFGTGPIEAKPGHRVRLTSAEIIDVPDGMEVVFIRLRSSDDPGGSVGALPEHLFSRRQHRYTELPSPIVIGGQKRPYYEFIFGLKITRPGKFRTGGVRVHYREGEQEGQADFPYLYHMNSAS